MLGDPDDPTDNSIYMAARGPPHGLLGDVLENTVRDLQTQEGHPGIEEWRRVLELRESQPFLQRLQSTRREMIYKMFDGPDKWKTCVCAIAKGGLKVQSLTTYCTTLAIFCDATLTQEATTTPTLELTQTGDAATTPPTLDLTQTGGDDEDDDEDRDYVVGDRVSVNYNMRRQTYLYATVKSVGKKGTTMVVVFAEGEEHEGESYDINNRHDTNEVKRRRTKSKAGRMSLRPKHKRKPKYTAVRWVVAQGW